MFSESQLSEMRLKEQEQCAGLETFRELDDERNLLLELLEDVPESEPVARKLLADRIAEVSVLLNMEIEYIRRRTGDQNWLDVPVEHAQVPMRRAHTLPDFSV